MTKYPIKGDSLLLEIAEGIATATLNRPAQHNALSRELRENLLTVLQAANEDDEVGVIIITGAGDKAFSVGLDLKEVEHAPLQLEEMGVEAPIMKAFAALQKPTIAAVGGYAVTGGFELAVNCDIIVASTDARFADTHARIGIMSAWGLSQLLPRIVGPVRARYLSFTGNYLDAATAKEWGLALEVVEPAELLPCCRKIACDILSCDATTLREIQRSIRFGLGHSLDEGLAFEGKLARDYLKRFDVERFKQARDATMQRGKTQLAKGNGALATHTSKATSATKATPPVSSGAGGIAVLHDGAVATISLDLAQPKNSFRIADVTRLSEALDEAVAAGARCLVLRGAGPVFSAGWDVTAIDLDSRDPSAMITEIVGPICRKLRELPLPTISAVAGVALGFGLGLALSCDLCLAEEEALFGSPFRQIGMVPDSGTHAFFLSRLGPAMAAELIYTGRLLRGKEAAERGLINRAVATGQIAAEARKLAQEIAAGPTEAFRLSKQVLLEGGDIDAVVAHEARQLQKVFATADLREGILAFRERRKPAFLGR
jgi:enoyl-CoA hydratase/carnithine racemase